MNDTTNRISLLDELAKIDAALTDGEATPEQEKRGQEIVSLADAAPAMLAALRQAVTALNTAPRFKVPCLGTDSYKIAAVCDRAIDQATG